MNEIHTYIEFPVTVEYDYTPEDIGRVSGPPEYCYPPEPEQFEITKLLINGQESNIELTDAQYESIKDEALREMCESREDYGEYLADQQKDKYWD